MILGRSRLPFSVENPREFYSNRFALLPINQYSFLAKDEQTIFAEYAPVKLRH
jgi:hypothetical protein